METGAAIAHYRIVSRLGAGGMGEVFLAEDTRLHRKVALKVLLRSEEHTSELQSLTNLVCRLLLEKKKKRKIIQEQDHNGGVRAAHAQRCGSGGPIVCAIDRDSVCSADQQQELHRQLASQRVRFSE